MPSLKEFHKVDPHCRKCRRLTRLNPKGCQRLEDDTATREHIYPRGHPDRAKFRKKQELYCFECNQTANEYWHRTGKLYSEYPGTLTKEQVRALKKQGTRTGKKAKADYLGLKRYYRL